MLIPRHAWVGILILSHLYLAGDRVDADTQDFLYYESASLGTIGGTGPGLPVSDRSYDMARFHLDAPLDVMAIGGHLYQEVPCPFGCNDLLWGGIVALDAPDAYPHGAPMLDQEILAETTFDAGRPSSDVIVPLSVMLEPGDYGIVFGSARMGALGGGIMLTNNPTLPGASYARWSATEGGWIGLDYESDGPRFTLYGLAIPEPCTLGLLCLGGLVLRHRRRIVGGNYGTNNRISAMELAGLFRGHALPAKMYRSAWVGMLIVSMFGLVNDQLKADTQALYYESATLGQTGGYPNGLPVSDRAYNMARIHLDEPLDVSAIGGHLFQEIPCPFGCNNLLWGGIVTLDAADAFPHGAPLLEPEILAETTFDAGRPSNDAVVPLSVMLEPGDYGIVFGTARLDAIGAAIMPTNNSTLPGASYARWTDTIGWQDLNYASGEEGPRFTLYGSTVPEPCSLGLLALGAVGLVRRRRAQLV